MNRIKRAKAQNSIMTVIFYAIAVFFFVLLAAFAGYVIIKGFIGADISMFRFARRGSIGNQLFNTLYLVFLSLLITVPIGTFAGIYLAMYAKGGAVTKFIRICIETLSSLPSIVVGLFGYLIFLVIMGMDKSLMAGALSVSIITLPLITTTTEDAIKGLPKGPGLEKRPFHRHCGPAQRRQVLAAQRAGRLYSMYYCQPAFQES